MRLPDDTEILEHVIPTVRNIVDVANLVAQGHPMFKDLRKQFEASFKDKNNFTRFIDWHTHNILVAALETKWPGLVEIYGEEINREPPEKLDGVKKLVAFIDPIDGTDLQDRDFSNWVSALIFVVPAEKRIVSVVAHSSGDVYFASAKGAFVRLRRRQIGDEERRDRPLRCNPNKVIGLEEASVCFYGQKPKSFLAVAKHEAFRKQLEVFAERMKLEELRIRLYNFGGNPMMVRVPSRKDNPGAVDVVFNLSGSKIYDVMPGAFIACRSGAIFRNPDNNRDIDPLQPLLRPREKIGYILSASRDLANELYGVLSKNTSLVPSRLPDAQASVQ